MRNILRIFTYDLKTLSQHFFASVVAIALCILPCLYAWLNIYSNWDPYGNTGNISIAVASNDEGFTDEDGEYINKGDEVIADLRESTAIDWVFPETDDEAIDGVYSGKYYAAIVIDEDFSYNMYNMLTEWTGKPSLTYYENAKKNAVAPKITDTAVENVKSSINEAYLEVVINAVMEQANLISEDLEEDDPSGAIHGVIKKALQATQSAQNMLAKTGGGSLTTAQLDTQKLDELIMKLNEGAADTEKMRQTVAQISMGIDQTAQDINYVLEQLQKAADSGAALDAFKTPLTNSAQKMTEYGDSLKQMAADGSSSGMTQETKTMLENFSASCYAAAEWLNTIANSSVLDKAIFARTDSISAIIEFNQSLMPCVEDINAQVEYTLTNVANLLESSQIMLQDATLLRGALGNVKSAGQDVVTAFKPTVQRVVASLSDVLNRLDSLDGEQYIQTLIEILGGDPLVYGEYFAQVVQTTATSIYPIENYGSAMAPFYSVLAIWVGGVILGSILKVQARKENLIDPKPHELYFGRYLIFFCLNQLQAALIITGDLFILKIQCLHPGLLYFCGMVTSFTFSLLIYSFAVSFGDVGKAIVVVVMVLQVAGSSGTFPVELLPDIYQKIYRFFPFPYAIDAMRECICGLYGNTYVVKLGQLLIFAVIALAIGLFARKPFIHINEYMEERLEETEIF